MNTTNSLELPSRLDAIREILATRSAADAAEMFLSPFVNKTVFLEGTRDEGPSLWVVNRSDVYDETLEMLSEHSIAGIAARAKEKLMRRRTTLTLLEPPVFDQPLNETPDYMIEDVLGHPLVPFDAILYFTDHPIDDFRGSAALSLCRRLLEHAPNWNVDLGLKFKVQETFSRLLIEDPSPFVRAYCARIPMLDASVITDAFKRESHPKIQAKILQNPAVSQALINEAAMMVKSKSDIEPTLAEVALLDRRIDRDLRKSINESQLRSISPFASHINGALLNL